MIKENEDLKLELDKLKKLTAELREVKETNKDTCPDCRRYASIAYKTAEKYYEILIRAEIIEATWYKKGGVDCEKIDCECKRDNELLKNKMLEATAQLADLTSTVTITKEDKT